ncbi:MAG: bifunctional glutamate--cysteine ligase GshA/glutathione synthetase GshB, partial [Turicibacter sp.]
MSLVIAQFKELFTVKDLLGGHFGIEREALRVNAEGELATSPHPAVFGSKLTHPFITTDFAESQLELITPTLTSLDDVHHTLTGLFDIVVSEIGDELIWPQSMPAVVNEEKIKVSRYLDDDAGQEAAKYREMLLQKYGGSRQLISGIHYNFSFSDDFLKTLFRHSNQPIKFKEFKNDIYLKVVRNYLRYRWLLIYLLGATPMLHETYDTRCSKKLNKISQGTFTNGAAISYRNSMCGYKNKHQLLPNYDSVESYVNSLYSFIDSEFITSHKELYSSIRLKAKDPHHLLDSLLDDGIQYLEIRSIDINPFEKSGIALNDLYFIHLFILFLATEEEVDDANWQEEANYNENQVALHGLSDDTLLTREGLPQSIQQYGADVLEKILKMNEELVLGKFDIIEEKIKMVNKEIELPSQRLIKMSKKTNYLEAHFSLAKTYKEESLANPFGLVGYEDMELSTQILIRESLKQGISVEILDRAENFIALKKGDKVEYVKQATKTSLDSYSTVLVMENKVVTKEILNQHKIKVPGGAVYHSIEEAQLDASNQMGEPIVVKPKSTNFGLGISIFTDGASKEDFHKAIEIAFNYDNTVLVEEFISGKEYRFLV